MPRLRRGHRDPARHVDLARDQRRRREHLKEPDRILDRLYAKRATVEDEARQKRLSETITTLERRLYEQEGGPTGNGPASTIIANSTGCSSVYASTMPFNNYLDRGSTASQDAQPLAKGIFEGSPPRASPTCAPCGSPVRIHRLLRPEVHDEALMTLSWAEYSPPR